MRTVEEQLAIITAAASTPEPVRIAISDALGLRCAERVEGTQSLPSFNQAAIDGFAVRAVDVRNFLQGLQQGIQAEEEGQPPRAVEEFPVVGDISAGSQRPVRLQPRQAVRVETGAPLPNLADAVLPLDWAESNRRWIRPLHPVNSGEFVHREGSDVQPGDVVVEQGTVIGAAQVGLLAAAGRSKVLVYPKPRMSVMSFGQELVDIDRDAGLGHVYDINSYSLAAAGREAGAEVNRIGVINGEPRKLKDLIEGQLMRSEVVVIAGGVGGAASDRLREVVGELGEMDVSRIAMHPGSVLGFGRLGPDAVPTFLLPSNPSAALVVFEVLVRPLIQLIRGQRQATRRVVQARTIAPIESAPGRRGFIRGQLMRDRDTMEFLVDPLGAVHPGEPTHLLGSHGQANCLIVVPSDAGPIPPGHVVDVMFLSNQS
ncbi:molybdopterin molybdotransferase MoeA [Corynebacterium sp. 320]|uniref:Molybdopterin molybdenumtransferase n=1 Tax=Corynebacterium zhongnanshanii TaxID=2768834 RepID=A0ABQ6VFG2_9CORY|nr:MULTISPECIES: gephyrin-like molybdotransferase Glp [Corynebacterium]KAB1504099.1 molybdopterin molybdotransferase MoeA [Corynebacterium sp. 320]KAB1552803.1 molybdopterin molybdotransferase MoeA [Corynebacterium sp. 321]KAB1553979.1 molybdopterin molybdotransferase MoeA [Corynebacterium sp. 319]KAB3523048.1 molybdopterin molybdotransferase MoeA [Corynebacterium zhongnanshanii]KAB3528235.1 molybdopterin molybdotransferase MoeA [Corynebacterium sp. 250]